MRNWIQKCWKLLWNSVITAICKFINTSSSSENWNNLHNLPDFLILTTLNFHPTEYRNSVSVLCIPALYLVLMPHSLFLYPYETLFLLPSFKAQLNCLLFCEALPDEILYLFISSLTLLSKLLKHSLLMPLILQLTSTLIPLHSYLFKQCAYPYLYLRTKVAI